jgi:hypothetical protein
MSVFSPLDRPPPLLSMFDRPIIAVCGATGEPKRQPESYQIVDLNLSLYVLHQASKVEVP